MSSCHRVRLTKREQGILEKQPEDPSETATRQVVLWSTFGGVSEKMTQESVFSLFFILPMFEPRPFAL